MFYQLWTFGSNYLSSTQFTIVTEGNKKEKQTEHIQ